MSRFNYIIAALGLVLALSGAALAQVPAVMDGKDIMPYLNQMIDWQRRLSLLEMPTELPRLQIIRNTLHQHTAKAVAASFSAAREIAETLPPPPPATAADGADAKGHNLQKAIANATQQVRDLQAALAQARSPQRRAALDGQLKLAQEHLSLIKTIATAVGAKGEGDDDSLDAQITKLSETLPEADGGTGKQTAVAAAAAAAPPAEVGAAGVIADLYDFIKQKQQVKALRNETQAMLDDSRTRSRAIRDTVQSLMAQGVEIGKASDGAAPPNPDPKAAPAPKAPTYDELLADMKLISAVAVPLSELNVALDASIRDLGQWSDALSQQIRDMTRRLAWRLGVMGSTILGLCLLSMLFARATRRYILDERRQMQLRTFRKLVLMLSIALVVFLGFFTDLTSLATFAGLITAGLAVALQTVILSVVAFFQFFGSFGIRVGDRITIQGVTGRVMQIGMTRFYLMELDRSDVGFLPTGRIVGFPNSILFQPLPFVRQVPGTNFVWSEIKLTLDPTMDHEAMYKKIHEVVTRVYSQQRDIIQTQEMALHNITRFKVQMADPQLYLRITGTGLLLTIRYAVQREQETELHLKMTEALLAVIKKDPELKFVGVG